MGPHVVLLHPYFKCMPRVLMVIRVGKVYTFIVENILSAPD
jgi:hypothetical protein